MTKQELLTPEQVAEHLGFSVDDVYKAVEEQELPAIKLGENYRIPANLLEDWIQQQLGEQVAVPDFLDDISAECEELVGSPLNRSQPEKSKKQTGVVTRYSPHGKEFGFIIAEDGSDVFLRGDLARGLGIETGDVIKFVTTSGRPYPVALQIELVEKTRFKQHHDAEKLYKEALDARQQGYSERAGRLFRETINNGAFLLVFTIYAEMEKKFGKPRKALDIIYEGLKVFPRVGELYRLGAELLLQLGRTKEALALLERGISYVPSFYNNHRLYLRTLISQSTVDSFQNAVSHAQSLEQYGIVQITTTDDRLLHFLRGHDLPHNVYKFFIRIGFDISLRESNGHYTDFTVSSAQPEYIDAYGLYERILVRCFLGDKHNWEEINDFRVTWQNPDTDEKNLNPDISFVVLNDVRPLRNVFYKILADGKDAIVPLDEDILGFDEPTVVFREQLNNWLSRRDLYKENFPVSGRQFFGREVEIQRLMRSINEGQNVGIFGLRKVGKTSVLYQLRDKSKQDIVAYVDLQSVPAGVHGTAYIYWNIAYEICRQFHLKYPKICESIKLRLGSTSSYDDIHQPEKRNAIAFDKELKIVLRRLADVTPEAKVIILIDELERMLPTETSQGFSGFSDFFALIRGIAQQERGRLVSVIAAANPLICEKAKWNNLDNPVFRYYEELYLPLLKQPECEELITELGRRMGVTYRPESLNLVYEQTGGHPFLVRRLCSYTLSIYPTRPIEVFPQMLEDSLEPFLLNEGSTFGEILERLEQDFPLEYDLLRFIVSGVQSRKELAQLVIEPVDQALRHLIGYQLISYNDGVYRVKINLLSEWLRKEGIV